MKFGVVNKSTTVNRFVLHTLQRNITHLAVITRKTNIKLGILKGRGKLEKSLPCILDSTISKINLAVLLEKFAGGRERKKSSSFNLVKVVGEVGGWVKGKRALFPFPPTCKFLHVNLLTTLSDCYENLHTD